MTQRARALSIVIGGAGWVFALIVLLIVSGVGLVSAVQGQPGSDAAPTAAPGKPSPTAIPKPTPTDAPPALWVLAPARIVSVAVDYGRLASHDPQALAQVRTIVTGSLPPDTYTCIGQIMVHLNSDGVVANANVSAGAIVTAISLALTQDHPQRMKGTNYAAILDTAAVLPGYLSLDVYPGAQCSEPGQ